MKPRAPKPAGWPDLDRFNALGSGAAHHALHACCSSHRWAAAMTEARPFASPDALLAAADAHWLALGQADWLEAFAHHPRIGQTDLKQKRFAPTAEQSAREQSGMAGASDELRAAFHIANTRYQDKFGFVFLICATGKTGEEMLAELRRRLANDAPSELRNAVEQQRLITRLRLRRLVNA